MTQPAPTLELPAPRAPRAIPRDQALALFAQWYDAHEGDQDATFTFRIRDQGRTMEALIEEHTIARL